MKYKNLPPSWGHLSLVGNTHIAKVVTLAPLIAQAVYYSGDFVTEYFGVIRVTWLYWSLIILAIGQFVYLCCAPRDIKKYGMNFELFASDAYQTYDDLGFEFYFREYIKSFFKNANHRKEDHNAIFGDGKVPSFEISDISRTDLTALLEKDKKEGSLIRARTASEERVDALYAKSCSHIAETFDDFRAGLQGPYSIDHIDWNTIWLLSHVRPDLFGIGQNQQFSQIHQKLGADNRSWRNSSLHWKYDASTTSRPIARWVVLALYFIGSIYFLYSVIRSLYLMAQFTYAEISLTLF